MQQDFTGGQTKTARVESVLHEINPQACKSKKKTKPL